MTGSEPPSSVRFDAFREQSDLSSPQYNPQSPWERLQRPPGWNSLAAAARDRPSMRRTDRRSPPRPVGVRASSLRIDIDCDRETPSHRGGILPFLWKTRRFARALSEYPPDPESRALARAAESPRQDRRPGR